MNNFNKQFVVERVMSEFIKDTKKPIPIASVTYTIKNEVSKVESIIIAIINPKPTGGIIGFGVYFGERNKLLIYDFNGDIISVHNNMIFKDEKKKNRKINTIKK